MEKVCELEGCNSVVPFNRKNGRYCCDDHQYEAKKRSNKEKYFKNKAEQEVNKADEILKHFFSQYGSVALSAQLLEDLKFPWGVCTSKDSQGIPFHQVKYFGFFLFNNNTIKIYRL
jgi:hypothetical protein